MGRPSLSSWLLSSPGGVGKPCTELRNLGRSLQRKMMSRFGVWGMSSLRYLEPPNEGAVQVFGHRGLKERWDKQREHVDNPGQADDAVGMGVPREKEISERAVLTGGRRG